MSVFYKMHMYIYQKEKVEPPHRIAVSEFKKY